LCIAIYETNLLLKVRKGKEKKSWRQTLDEVISENACTQFVAQREREREREREHPIPFTSFELALFRSTLACYSAKVSDLHRFKR